MGEDEVGHTVLRLAFPGTPFSRTVLAKRQKEEDGWPAARSLFVTHLDPYVTEKAIENCFGAFGKVEKVMLKRTPKRGDKKHQIAFARIKFKDAGSVDTILETAEGILQAPPPVWKRMAAAARPYVEPDDLQAAVDTFMIKHEEREAAERAKQDEVEVDDDGFTKVKSGTTRTEDGHVIKSFRAAPPKVGAFDAGVTEGVAKKKKKAKEVDDFYSFQLREKQRLEVASERRKRRLEENAVEKMKSRKAFKM
jgi:hypothetical protein